MRCIFSGCIQAVCSCQTGSRGMPLFLSLKFLRQNLAGTLDRLRSRQVRHSCRPAGQQSGMTTRIRNGTDWSVRCHDSDAP